MEIAIMLTEAETEAIEDNPLSEACDGIYQLGRKIKSQFGVWPVLFGVNESERIYELKGLMAFDDGPMEREMKAEVEAAKAKGP